MNAIIPLSYPGAKTKGCFDSSLGQKTGHPPPGRTAFCPRLGDTQAVAGGFKRIIKQFQVTALYVTHDVTEVYKLADYVVVLASGKVIKQGTPEEVFLGKN